MDPPGVHPSTRRQPTIVGAAYGRNATLAMAAAIERQKGGDPFARVTVVVPSNHAGMGVRRVLGSGRAGSTKGLVNVSFVTPYELASRLGAATASGIPLTDAARVAAVRAELAADRRGFFARVAGHRATEQALCGVYRELAAAHDLTLDRLATSASARTRAVVGLVRAVRRRLAAYADERDVAAAALAAVDAARVDAARVDAAAPVGQRADTQVGGLSEIGSLLLFELSELSPLHAELIGALSARFTVDAIVGLTGVTDLDERAYMLAQRLLPAASVTHPRPTPASITRLVTATDSDDEVRCVLREVMALAESGVAFDRIAVLYTSGDPYARILREQLAAAAIPHYGPGIRRLGDSVTGRTLRSLLALDSTNLARGALIDLLSAAPLTFQGATIPTTAWDQLSRQAGVVRGADDWHRKLHAYRAVLAQRGRDLSGDDSSAGRLAHNRRQIEQLDSLAAFVTQLAADLAPEPAPCHWRDFAEWSDGLLRRYLDSSGVASAPAEKEWPSREREAYDAVREVLRLIASLDQLQPEPTLEQFVLTVLAELDTANDRIGRSGEGVLFGPTFSPRGSTSTQFS